MRLFQKEKPAPQAPKSPHTKAVYFWFARETMDCISVTTLPVDAEAVRYSWANGAKMATLETPSGSLDIKLQDVVAITIKEV